MQFKLDLTPLKLNPGFVQKLNLPQIMEQEMMNVRARIVKDTTSGKQAEGGGLKPYSASYKKQIDSGRIAGKAPGSHTPNLTATQQLLRSIVTQPIQNGVSLVFQGMHSARRLVSSAGARRKQAKTGVTTGTVRKGTRVHGAAKKPHSVKGGGRSVPNATIAAAQYEMGRTGWFTFSSKDVKRIEDRVRAAIDAGLKNLVAPNKR